jgi:Domain of unknown function (DUF6968)
MAPDDLGEIIATRYLRLAADNHTERTISIFVGKPRLIPDASGYLCPFQVVGAGSEQTQTAQGCDSLQALQAALILIGAILNHLNDQFGRRLSWEGHARGELGFP